MVTPIGKGFAQITYFLSLKKRRTQAKPIFNQRFPEGVQIVRYAFHGGG